jgi:hypothetical protein
LPCPRPISLCRCNTRLGSHTQATLQYSIHGPSLLLRNSDKRVPRSAVSAYIHLPIVIIRLRTLLLWPAQVGLFGGETSYVVSLFHEATHTHAPSSSRPFHHDSAPPTSASVGRLPRLLLHYPTLLLPLLPRRHPPFGCWGQTRMQSARNRSSSILCRCISSPRR